MIKPPFRSGAPPEAGCRGQGWWAGRRWGVVALRKAASPPGTDGTTGLPERLSKDEPLALARCL